MDAFLSLKNLGSLDPFPGGAQLDQDAVLGHTLGLVHADQLLGLGNLEKLYCEYFGGNSNKINKTVAVVGDPQITRYP